VGPTSLFQYKLLMVLYANGSLLPSYQFVCPLILVLYELLIISRSYFMPLFVILYMK
jgi:hypothetical protein